ncbi:glycosyltransferase family 4 protein [Comamonas endophytica]|uniref:Glycosyltransferase family 4 protein n=1 Tax=Comamonas endophytica TaxID=2949090 RepID=A0ABY6GEW3_9BURK|nr:MULTISPECIES: glycosyltransferase family 1 protein [unclassified Acidovorax]MCD2512423.1 glycosyltransferase family 4 protein [Acidovorax sp. D4N7]UYG53205.1 glycosyltransferase family 4 protein [Acidovorax sp. 5MLIR]
MNNEFRNSTKPILMLGVAPLWELEYTGISNVVFELTKRFFFDQSLDFEVRFSVFDKVVDKNIIKDCLDNRSGANLQASFQKNEGISEIEVDEYGRIEGRLSYGLFLHTKPHRRVFHKDSHLYYDFSFLLTQECHTQDTINFHLNGLTEQISSTDLFFCISESTASDLRWLFNVPKEKTVVALLGNNVNTDIASKARELIGDREIEPYLLILGTIEPRKNIALIFEWLKKNPNLLKKYRFVFAGRQGWGPAFADYAEKTGLSSEIDSGRIVHLGYVDESLKATLIVGAQAIFYPSIFEGFGLPVLEAMELGVPVIASCSTSIPEVLGDTGYYFDPYSVESLDVAFSKFLFDQCTGQLEIQRKKASQRAAEFSYDRTYTVICDSLKKEFLDSQTN